jgi:RNA polymerase sigma-70 factor (ECF subfamily)
MVTYSALSDQELITLLKDGDKTAFTEIYGRFFGVLYVFVHKKLKDEGDAKDIVQDLFTNIWIKRESLSFSGALSAYLYTAVRNKMLDVIGHKDYENRYIQSLQGFMDQEQIQSDFLIREKQLAALIEQEIDALPAKMREVFLLSRRANMSYKEIALQLDLSEQTVRSHVKHALKILRIRLGLFVYLVYFFKIF